VGGETYNLACDAEGHLITVTKGANTIASFTYDGDGKRVKSVMDSETTLGACPELVEGPARTTKSISPAAQSPSATLQEIQE
jgi:YD repeat-containing protein